MLGYTNIWMKTRKSIFYEKDGVALELNYIRYYMPATTNPWKMGAKGSSSFYNHQGVQRV